MTKISACGLSLCFWVVSGSLAYMFMFNVAKKKVMWA